MATAPTLIGPVTTRQINNTLYVGRADLPNIQSAVNVAVKIGGSFLVVVPFDYAGADTIAAVTGGTANIEIQDLRGGANQLWHWDGTNYVVSDFNQLGNVGINGVAEVTGQLNAFGGISTEIIYVGQTPAVAGAKVGYIGTNPTTNIVDFQAETMIGIFDQTLRLNFFGGNVLIGSGVSVDHAGAITGGSVAVTGTINGGSATVTGAITGGSAAVTGTITAAEIQAADAQFATCEVANSPVRTFANTADAPAGMIWPPIGIAVSAGDHWQAPSIDPATLATWPAAGIAVSTGSAWGTPINAANIPLLNAANTFTANQTINGSITAGIPTLPFSLNSSGTDGELSTINKNSTTIAAGIKLDSFSSDFSRSISYLHGYDDGTTYHVDIPSAVLSVIGRMTVGGLFTCANTRLRIGERVAAPPWNTGTPNINGNAGGIFLNASGATGQIIFNWDQGGGGVLFGNGGPTAVASIDGTGKGTFTALAVSGAKTFHIHHPSKEDKDLVHACLEGPENGVYYRGEGTTVEGWAEITLPDYFEALVKPEARTVLLTPLFENEDEPISMLAASRVKDGKFKVWSGVPAQKFYWEVKAVRGDIEPLEVEPQRTEIKLMPQPTQGEKTDDDTTNGIGTDEDGELQPENASDAAADSTGSKRARRAH